MLLICNWGFLFYSSCRDEPDHPKISLQETRISFYIYIRMNLTEIEDQPLDIQWEYLLESLGQMIGKRPADLNGVLFLIGVQELGQGARRFTKEQKQDLMHIGICKVLSLSSYYVLEYIDEDGWPHYMLNRALPQGGIDKQEALLKMHIMEYFKNN